MSSESLRREIFLEHKILTAAEEFTTVTANNIFIWTIAMQRNQQLMTGSKKNEAESWPLTSPVLALQWLKGPHSCAGIIDWGNREATEK